MFACANSRRSQTNTHDHPNTTLGGCCVWRWKTRTNGRSSAHTIADRAHPVRLVLQSPCAHRLLPPRRTGGDAETLTIEFIIRDNWRRFPSRAAGAPTWSCTRFATRGPQKAPSRRQSIRPKPKRAPPGHPHEARHGIPISSHTTGTAAGRGPSSLRSCHGPCASGARSAV